MAMCGLAEISPETVGSREYSIGATKLFFSQPADGFAATVVEETTGTALAHLHRPGSVAVRRGVGCSGN
jgi:hypothetical protein